MLEREECNGDDKRQYFQDPYTEGGRLTAPMANFVASFNQNIQSIDLLLIYLLDNLADEIL